MGCDIKSFVLCWVTTTVNAGIIRSKEWIVYIIN